ncbi:DDT domain-containing protein DDR4-like [Salvia splendens]|uniref:DDT domain-containing protein DDR4-like n=1 Tax=Salvia splendens TaxID=180675 RepID=UPI0011025811|nr:DDT domain-containing protein DDR4-like [Salvia splendens]
MQALDLPCNPSRRPDPSAMPEHYSPIHSPDHHSLENNTEGKSIKENYVKSANDNNGNSNVVTRRERPSRACTERAGAKLQAAAEAEAERKKKRREKLTARLLKNESEEEDGYRDSDEEENGEEDGSNSLTHLQSSRAITPLLGEPEASQLPRWNTRSMWQLASILNFLNVFRPLLNVKMEFSAEEFETALIIPNNTLAEIHMPMLKRKEKLLKKQHRQALMLDNMIGMDAIAAGRSLRDRKPVTYTFDDYDRSINEAIKVTKQNKQSPEHFDGGDPPMKHELSRNGRLDVTSQHSQNLTFSAVSPISPYEDDVDDDDDDEGEFYEDHKTETLDRSDRRKQRHERYSVKDYVEAVSDIEADFDSDDDIVGEVVYDDEYLKRRKRRKMSSSSEGDEEYHWDEENHEEEEEEEEDDILSSSEDSDAPRHTKALPGRTRRETKLRSVGDLKSGLRRSKMATRNRINYKQYEMSESDNDQTKTEKSNVPNEPSYSNGGAEFSTGMQDSDEKISNQEDVHADQLIEVQQSEVVEEKPPIPPEQENHGDEDVEMVSQRGFLDLNELAPGSGCDDGPNSVRDDDRDGF